MVMRMRNHGIDRIIIMIDLILINISNISIFTTRIIIKFHSWLVLIYVTITVVTIVAVKSLMTVIIMFL